MGSQLPCFASQTSFDYASLNGSCDDQLPSLQADEVAQNSEVVAELLNDLDF